MFLNFRNSAGGIEAGVNLDQVMSWTSNKTEEGVPYVLLSFAVMASELSRGTGEKPWSMRLTGPEREQFLAAMAQR
jgi:hypothetical protein